MNSEQNIKSEYENFSLAQPESPNIFTEQKLKCIELEKSLFEHAMKYLKVIK